MTAEWLIPTVLFIFATGSFGITSKMALRHLRWQEVLMWSGIGYILLVAAMVIIGQTQVQFVTGSGWAAFSAAIVIIALFAIYIALNGGQAGKVVPVTASYPVVTLILAAIFLSEHIALLKAGGVALVVVGVVVLTMAK